MLREKEKFIKSCVRMSSNIKVENVEAFDLISFMDDPSRSSSALHACSISISSSAFGENKKYRREMLLWGGRWNGNKSQS